MDIREITMRDWCTCQAWKLNHKTDNEHYYFFKYCPYCGSSFRKVSNVVINDL